METTTAKQQMEKSLQHLENELKSFQLGRANTSLIENVDIFIPSRNMKQKLNQMANISVIDAQTLKVECRDKSSLSSVEKGIYDANIGLTPQNLGEYIMIKIPPLTQERRKDLTKLVSKYAEDTKIGIRNIRQDSQKEIKKEFDEKKISEDQKKSLESEIDSLVKDFNTKIDTISKNKSEEIMKI
ncbi:MAG TPA: ribosome recycling factor [Candidatus Absconditabacterales bacterium]|nr:ribosome recycling factor [Candidatus Absconditabacterales bacterium]HMT26669.1 ribosome recycling factor [Candidatus Absconditabacterales bacterium]